uniref:Uncharacterized protein n=1 Tax=Opuntia streptacantha TaxID=393608 RepID=A0A7C9AP33_OPUST
MYWSNKWRWVLIESKGAKRSLGTMSCFKTTWQKFPVHLCRRSDFEREWLPRSGEPKVMQRTWGGEGLDWRKDSSHRVVSDASAPPMECPVRIIDLLFSSIAVIWD